MKYFAYGDVAIICRSKMEKNNDCKDLSVTNCGYFIDHNNEHNYYALDDNNQYLLIYNHLGEIIKYEKNKNILVPEHSIIILKPNEIRKYKFKKCETSERYYVYFKGKKVEEYLKRTKLHDKNIFHTPNLSSIIPIFKSILYDFKLHDFNDDIYRSSLLLQLLTTISLSIEKQNNKKNPISSALAYIQNNYHKNITLADLAKESYMSINTFIEVFKSITGKTPIRYLNELRLNKAQFFLIETNSSLTTIAEQLGFNNVAYFSNFFKKELGISPSEFRNKNKKIIENKL